MSAVNSSPLEVSLIKKYLAFEARSLEVSFEDESGKKDTFSSLTEKTDSKLLQRNLLRIKGYESSIEKVKNLAFSSKKVSVNFYFNRLGLYFSSRILFSENSFCIMLPEEFFTISETQKSPEQEIYCVLFYETGNEALKKNCLEIKCTSLSGFNILKKPSFTDLEREGNIEGSIIDKKVKNWIREVILSIKEDSESRINVSDGLFLIPIGRYLIEEKKTEVGQIEGRAKNPGIIFIDDKRIVFAGEKDDMVLVEGKNYKIKIFFPLAGPIKARIVEVNCFVSVVFENYEKTRLCANAEISSLREEDRRFLSEISK